MRKIDRFIKYMTFKGLNDNKVTIACGLSRGLLGQARSGKSDLGQKTIDKILEKYQDINRVWLLTGEGDMLRSDGRMGNDEANRESSAYRVRLLPLSAHRGSLSDFAATVKDSDCEMVVSPVMGADFAIQVNGDSMSPEYPSSSTILIKRINENAFIEWGKAYVLDTENGSVVKLVVKSEKEGHIRCQSINPDPRYAPFDVPLGSIFGIYRVLMCMSMK